MTAKFSTGRFLATPGVMSTFELIEIATSLGRHRSGDWGDLSHEDKATNERALSDGSRLLSSYKLGTRTLWIITEAADDEGERISTTALLPSEY